MCRAATCKKCGGATWKGCGAHVDQVMAGVPEDKRCRCAASGPAEPRTSPATTKSRFWRRG